MTTPRSSSPSPWWTPLDQRHVWHPYTHHFGGDAPPPIARAEGAYLYDTEGRAILDAISSWWVTLHGHAHPTVAEAVARQAATLEQVIFAGFTHEPAARLAAELVEVLPPGLARVFFSDDGSTAVEVALKMALQYWRNRGQKRTTIVALENAYHGDTFGAMSVSGSGVFTEPFSDHLFQVERLPDPSRADVVLPFARLLAEHHAEIAAIIVEPLLMGAGGMRVWNATALTALHGLAAEFGVLFIADEVLTGFGRTGPRFACEHAGITPDLICLSKGLTGGFLPLGATVAREDVFAEFTRGPDRRLMLFHGHSFTANPIACAAARASLSLLDARCAERRRAIELAHREGMARLKEHPRVRGPRVLGTVAAFDLDVPGGYLSPIGAQLARFALENGVLLRPLGSVVYLLPPYAIEPDEVARVYDVIARFLESRC